MTTRILSPEGAVGPQRVALAPLPATLKGQRILVLDNGKPGAQLVLERAAEELAARTGAVFAGSRRKRTAATPCEEALLAEIEQSADVVLTGTAD